MEEKVDSFVDRYESTTSTKKYEKVKLRRIVFFDIIKSLSIDLVVVFHSLLFDWTAKNDEISLPESEKQPTITIQILFFFLTMGGTFHMVSSCLACYSTLFHIHIRKEQPKKVLLYSVLKGLLYQFFHLLQSFVFSQFTGYLYFGLYPGKDFPSFKEVFDNLFFYLDTLNMVGFNLVVLSPLLFLLFRGNKFRKNINQKIMLMTFLGIVALLVTPFVRIRVNSFLYKTGKDRIMNDLNFVVKVLCSILSNNMFPIFPYVGYGLLGSALGLFMYDQYYFKHTQKKKDKWFYYVLAVVGVCFGAYGSFKLFSTFGNIYPGLFEEHTPRGMLFKSYLQYMQIFLILMIWSIFLPTQKSLSCPKLRSLSVVQNISLSVYLYEGIHKVIIYFPMTWIFSPNWTENMNLCILFGVFAITSWIFIGRWWKKYHWKYSAEWIFHTVVELFVKDVKSTKLHDR